MNSNESTFDIDRLPIPKCAEQANENLQHLAGMSRRSFFMKGAAAAAVPAAVVATSATAEAAGRNPLPTYVNGGTARYFGIIQRDEASHVNIIVSAIQSLGGTPRPFPTFQNITISNPQSFLTAAQGFENTGVGAYLGAAAYIQNPNVLAVAASIALVEGYHSGFINSVANSVLLPGDLTLAQPLMIPQIVAAASPYIVSLNDNGQFPATFSTTKSAANDIAILNFALLLEYLEAAFYFYSVPLVFTNTR